MHYNVTDKDGWTLAEGRIAERRIQRNREEAARVVERIERNQRIERLVRAADKGPRTGSAAYLLGTDKHASNASKVVDFIHHRNRSMDAPMATRRNYALTAAAVGAIWLAAVGISFGFWSGIAFWIFG